MLNYGREALALVAGMNQAAFEADRLLQLGVVRLLEIIGEAAARTPQTVRDQHADIDWAQIVGLRNRLIHGYDMVDLAIVWTILIADLPTLVERLEEILEDGGRPVTIRPEGASDDAWARAMLAERWASTMVASLSGLHDAATLDGFVAEADGRPAGLVTYRVADGECEIVTLDSLVPGQGIGTALLQAAAEEARTRGCRRAWLVTTNDNLPALRFYQRRGWSLVAVHRDAVHAWRRTVKPQIPERGLDNIPLAHALELEFLLL